MMTMEHLPLVCLCLVTWSGITSADGNGPVVVEEGSDVVLPCSPSTKEDLKSKLFDWKKDGQKEVFMYDSGDAYKTRSGQDEQFKDRVSHFEDELKHGNASIKIINTKVADSGNYSCAFPLLQPSQTFHIKLVVGAILKDRSGEISGASPRPYVRILETKDGVMLQCEVQGASPKPKVEWRDSAGKILQDEGPQVTERGGSYDIILKAKVTKRDNYRCVITQEEINHQTATETFVPVNDPPKSESQTGLIVGVVVGALLLVLVIIIALYFKRCNRRGSSY